VAVPYARGSHGGLERQVVGQRVTPAVTWRTGQLTIQVQVDRARQMSCPVTLDPRRAAKPPADVDQDRWVSRPQRVSERGDAYERACAWSWHPSSFTPVHN
jgi:hypothetical protein